MTDERTLPERLRERAQTSPFAIWGDAAMMVEAAAALEAAEQPRIAAGLDDLARQAVAHADALTKLRTAMESLREQREDLRAGRRLALRRLGAAERERDEERARRGRLERSVDDLRAMHRDTERGRCEALSLLTLARDDCRQAEARIAELEAEAARAVVFEPDSRRCPSCESPDVRAVIARFCGLAEKVATAQNFHYAADCICGEGGMWGSAAYGALSFRHEPAVMEFIERAVSTALVEYRPTADECEAAFAVMHDGAEMPGGAYRLTEDALLAAHTARTAELGRR